MQTYQRVLKYLVQPVLGEFDEDGNLVGENPQPVEPIFHPFGLQLENLTARLEKAHQRAREEQRRC